LSIYNAEENTQEFENTQFFYPLGKGILAFKIFHQVKGPNIQKELGNHSHLINKTNKI
jgi:hypothetical protein